MDASRKLSIATEVHARHKRPHRLALLATSPVATGEAIMPLYPKASPAEAGEVAHAVCRRGRHGRKP